MTTLQSLYESHLDNLHRTRITQNSKQLDSLGLKLCVFISDTPVHEITHKQLKEWFDSLTYHQQCKAKTALERFFDDLLLNDALPLMKYNCFGKGTGKFWLKEKPVKVRQRLLVSEYTAIRNCAIADNCTWFVHAMDLAFLLKLRRADVISLKFDHYDKPSKTLSKLILKSLNQKGADKAHTLVWELSKGYGIDVRKIIAEARTTRNVDIRYKIECSPYILHDMPERVAKKPPKDKTHHSQISDQMLSRAFKQYRDSVRSITKRCEKENSKPPTFHEIRSLSARMDLEKELPKHEISKALAHTSTSVTDVYLDEQVVHVTSLNRLSDVT